MRIPGWVPRELLKIEVAGKPVEPEWQGDFLFFENNMPVHLAASKGLTEITLALIGEFGCDPNVRGNFNRSVLHGACGVGESAHVDSHGDHQGRRQHRSLDGGGGYPEYAAA